MQFSIFYRLLSPVTKTSQSFLPSIIVSKFPGAFSLENLLNLMNIIF